MLISKTISKFKKTFFIFAAFNLAFFYVFAGMTQTAQANNSYYFVLDNDAPGFEAHGSWESSTHEANEFYGSDYLYGVGDETDGDYVTWTPSNSFLQYPGEYRVSAMWSDHSMRGQVNYEIYHNGKKDVVTKDQTTNGGQFNSLGTFEFSAKASDVEQVRLNNTREQGTDEYVIADAVKFELVDAYPATPVPLAPADGTVTNNDSPLLKWSPVNDPLESVTYEYRSEYDNRTKTYNHPSPIIDSQLLANGSPDSTYFWQVRAVDDSGNKSAWSNESKLVIDTVEPIAKIGDCLGWQEGDQVALTATSEDGTGSDIVSYDWQITKPGGDVINKTEPTPSFRVDIPGDYSIELIVEDEAGNQSDQIGPKNCTVKNIAPDSPALSLTRDDGIVKLSWNKDDEAGSYQVLRNGTVISGLLGPDDTQYTDMDTTNGQEYKYIVRAYDEDEGYGYGESNEVYSDSNIQETTIPQPEVRVEEELVQEEVVVATQPTVQAQPFQQKEGEVKAEDEDKEEDKIDEGKTEGEETQEEVEETAGQPKTNWPMIVAIIIAATIVLGGAAYWWYGISEDEDQI